MKPTLAQLFRRAIRDRILIVAAVLAATAGALLRWAPAGRRPVVGCGVDVEIA
jgi:hypothetical protein